MTGHMRVWPSGGGIGAWDGSLCWSDAPPPPQGGGTTYQTPDILNNASFETGWDGWTDWSGNVPPQNVSRDTTQAYSGSYSVVRTWTPNPSADTGSQFIYSYTAVDRLWTRFYFRLTATISTYFKFWRHYDPLFATNLGGLWIGADNNNGIIQAGWDQEDGSILTPIGLTQAQVINGAWHSLEVDYWRNGDPSGWPSMAFWFDNTPQSLPDGTAVTFQGSGNSSYWSGGRLYAGQRVSSVKLGILEALATLNAGNTTTGQVNIDRVAFSSLGRIGP